MSSASCTAGAIAPPRLKPSESTTSRVRGESAKTTLVFRGGTAEDPEHGAFIGVLPLTGALAEGPTLSDASLIALVRTAEQGTAARLVADAADYRSEGCQLAQVGGQRAGVCSGAATRHGDSVKLQTYLRVGAKRAVIAVFMARESVGDSRIEAAGLVASLAPWFDAPPVH